MATFFHLDALDALLEFIADNTTEVLLIDGYTPGDTYGSLTQVGDGTVVPGAGGADFAAITGTTDRVLQFKGVTGSASATVPAAQPLHIALTNGSSEVYAVTNETTNQAISIGNTLNFPAFNMTAKQPTQTA